MNLCQKIEALPTYKIPERYKWSRKVALDLEDIGFVNICDCLNKQKLETIGEPPADFDMDLFKKKKIKRVVWSFIKIEPEYFICGQRYLDKARLLEILVDPNPEHVRMLKVGKYIVCQDGHHRAAKKYLKNQRVYTKLSIL